MPSSSSSDATFGAVTPMRSMEDAGRRKFHTFGNLDPLLDALILRHDVLAAAADAEFAHHGGMRALQYFYDFAVGAAAGFDAGDAHHHPVAVHRLFRRFGRDENVSRDAFERPLGNQKAVAVAVHVEAPDGEFAAARGDHEMAGAQLDQIAARRQPGQRGFQFQALVAFGAGFPHELLEIGAGMRQAGRYVRAGPDPSHLDSTDNQYQ